MLAVETAALVVTLFGTVVSLAGAVWLFFGIKPDDRTFADDGQLYPGAQTSRVLPRFIRAQQRPSILVLVGGGVQVLGGVFAIVAG